MLWGPPVTPLCGGWTRRRRRCCPPQLARDLWLVGCGCGRGGAGKGDGVSNRYVLQTHLGGCPMDLRECRLPACLWTCLQGLIPHSGLKNLVCVRWRVRNPPPVAIPAPYAPSTAHSPNLTSCFKDQTMTSDTKAAVTPFYFIFCYNFTYKRTFNRLTSFKIWPKELY